MDEIDEWDKGKKNIVQESFGKVKEFINKAKGFDETPDYGYAHLSIFLEKSLLSGIN